MRGNIFSELGVVTPVSPLLAEIPEGDSDILFSFISRERTGLCAVGTKSTGESAFRTHGIFHLANDRIAARLTGMKPGDGTLKAVVKADDGRILASSEFPIRVQAKRALGRGTRLNNLVTRLLRAAKTASAGTYSFDMPREGWVWISLAAGTVDTKVYLDDAQRHDCAGEAPCSRRPRQFLDHHGNIYAPRPQPQLRLVRQRRLQATGRPLSCAPGDRSAVRVKPYFDEGVAF